MKRKKRNVWMRIVSFKEYTEYFFYYFMCLADVVLALVTKIVSLLF